MYRNQIFLLTDYSRNNNVHSPKCPHPNSQNLLTVLHHVGKGALQMRLSYGFWDWKSILDYLGGNNAITMVLIRGKERIKVRIMIMEQRSKMNEDLKILCTGFEDEGGATSQGIQVVAWNWINPGNMFSPIASWNGRNTALLISWF